MKFPLLYIKSLLTVPYDQAAQRRLAWTSQWMVRENGYSMQHGTRPQTLGYGLSDSPVGLLAWIYEKLVRWTDEYPWTDDEGTPFISCFSGPSTAVLTEPATRSP